MPNNQIIVKHNAAIRATYSLSLVEMRMMFLCIAQVRRDGTFRNRRFRIRQDAYCEVFGTSQGDSYGKMRDAAHRLQQRIITINERVVIDDVEYDGGSINVLSAQFWQEGEGEILLEFSERFMPYLEKLSGNFTKFVMRDIAAMKSVYSMRFYEMMRMTYEQQKTNSEKPHLLLEVAEIRKMFEIETKYKMHKDFKRRVIDVAVKEINELSPLTISYEQKKKGRRIDAYQFFIEKKASKFELKTTASKQKVEKAISAIKGAIEQQKSVSIFGHKIIDINGAIVSFDNDKSGSIYDLLVESDCIFDIGKA